MKLTIKSDILTEANSLYFTGYQIDRGFYLNNGFYVLPNTISNDELGNKKDYGLLAPIILFPHLDYQKAFKNIKGFRNNLNSMSVATSKELTPIVEELQKIEPSNNIQHELEPSDIRLQKKKYLKLLEPVIQKSYEVFHILKGKTFNIEVRLTNYGSYGSYTYFDINQDSIDISLRIRRDQPPETLVELVVSSILNSLSDVGADWAQKEATIDFFVKHVYGYSDYIGTIKRIKKTNKTLFKASIEYLLDLDLNIGDLLAYEKETNRIHLCGKDITEEFGTYEFRMLRYLVTNKRHTVTFDQLADEMYNVNADLKYSLWGITKTLQRVRGKLDMYGIPKEAIENVKGEGYKLIV